MHISANSESVQSGKKGLAMVLNLLIWGHCQKALPALGRIFPFQPSGNILTNLDRNIFLDDIRSYHVYKIIESVWVGVQLHTDFIFSRVRKNKRESRKLWKRSSLAREIISASLTLQINRIGKHLSLIITILVPFKKVTILYCRSRGICSLGGSITHQRFHIVKVLTYLKAKSELRMSLKKVVCATNQHSGRIIPQIQIIFKKDRTVVQGIQTLCGAGSRVCPCFL